MRFARPYFKAEKYEDEYVPQAVLKSRKKQGLSQVCYKCL